MFEARGDPARGVTLVVAGVQHSLGELQVGSLTKARELTADTPEPGDVRTGNTKPKAGFRRSQR